ncbi:inositol 2-dehydrogenase [Hoeflea prorocentri]|uniref:Inositol 2-dehydrogenase n=1 Tax=Hoeflea prorocentri TaxID=1922333 RepID=A0A9X3ZGF8_9HYPH|nr:inositol 2-dehydrogenase [Hoeflea prorocentri]MCY6379741.1 inositol 2-dehydrogenase [Hoeflea prorocentri]MDA5397541.1 inositol 2-dehydrogenase [Hoeflea prorocentri]
MKVAVFGAGRIAEVHVKGIIRAGHEVAGIYDIRPEPANALATQYGCAAFASPEDALGDPSIEAVVIGTSTNTHSDYIIACARAGKRIFCEKPIDLSVEVAENCWETIKSSNPFIHIGFNRRYDRHIRGLAEAVKSGELGKLENLTIISRDPAPAPIEYFKVSGGIFRDMTIHDFDIARFILGGNPAEIFATGSVLIDPEIGEIGDMDTTTVVMRSASGQLVQILNSRRAAYGFDQRIEAVCSNGMMQVDNILLDATVKYTPERSAARARPMDFFLERYGESYDEAWVDFFARLDAGDEPGVTFDDGLQALRIAEAANRSIRTGEIVKL